MLNKLFPVVFLVFSGAVSSQPAHVCQTENIPAATPTARFVNNADGTITDTQTDLMWKQCLEGLQGEECTEGESLALNWAQTLLRMPEVNQVGYANYSDWRLPNVRELSTLVETQCAHPAINLDVFPGALANHVWTSSPYHFYTHYSWYVDFAIGQPTYDERIRSKAIRLVRDIK